MLCCTSSMERDASTTCHGTRPCFSSMDWSSAKRCLTRICKSLFSYRSPPYLVGDKSKQQEESMSKIFPRSKRATIKAHQAFKTCVPRNCLGRKWLDWTRQWKGIFNIEEVLCVQPQHVHGSRDLAIHRGKPREPKRSAHLLRVSNRAKRIATTSTMYYSPPTFLRLVLVQIQKNDGIRRRQSNVRTHAPIQGQLPPRHRRPILGALGAGKSDAAVGVPVAYDVRPPRQRVHEIGRRLPSVGAEQQVDGSIIRLEDGGLEVFIDQSTHLGKYSK